jgi:hypothetical protein
MKPLVKSLSRATECHKGALSHGFADRLLGATWRIAAEGLIRALVPLRLQMLQRTETLDLAESRPSLPRTADRLMCFPLGCVSQVGAATAYVELNRRGLLKERSPE